MPLNRPRSSPAAWPSGRKIYAAHPPTAVLIPRSDVVPVVPTDSVLQELSLVDDPWRALLGRLYLPGHVAPSVKICRVVAQYFSIETHVEGDRVSGRTGGSQKGRICSTY